MALINCPECKKEVSDKAISCPYCGFPISPVLENEKDVIVQQNGKSYEMIRLQKAIIYLLFLAGLILLIPCIAQNKSTLTLIISGVLMGLAAVWFIVIMIVVWRRRN